MEKLKAYQCDKNGYFLHETALYLDPVRSEPVIHLNETTVEILKDKVGYVRKFDFNLNAWEYIENHKGENWYSKETGEKVEIVDFGKVADNLTDKKPLHYSKWDSSKNDWIIDSEKLNKAIEKAKKEGKNKVDDLVGNIYLKFTRFDKEYAIREAQALEFKSKNFKGEAPTQVKAFADGVGISDKEAAIIILQQATKLTSALETLGALRMQKYRIEQQATLEEVNHTTQSIINKINEIAGQI